ncbi:MAG: peptidylprolyl isomerase [Candidatus Aenigmarchaeota archaeon]|nr:peptidylprolyl isomerase [Candidatus Aenigmarchaeota archaeon]
MKVKKGDTVKVEYEGMLEDGTVFDSTKKHGGNPLEFRAGAGQMIPGFDRAVIGMKVGEEKTIKLKPADAYGEPKEYLIREIPKEHVPKDYEIKPGMLLSMTMPNGVSLDAKVKEVNPNGVKVDLNHPLAGKSLKFRIKVVEVE